MYLPKRFLNFDLGGILGSGSYGKVLAAVDYITGTRVAIKFVRKGQAAIEQKTNFEAKIQSLLDHRNICKLYEAISTPKNLVLILELVNGVDLHRYLRKHGRVDEQQARSFFLQMVDAIDYLHAHSIVHRDLKIENVIVENGGNIKICDFGLSTFYDSSSFLEEYCGTPQCAPPEIINGIPYVGPEVDIWCLGIILYAMVHGRLPFEDESTKSLNRSIFQAKMGMDESLSCELRDLLRKLIEPKRTMRIGMGEIMRHPWVNVTRKEHRRRVIFMDSMITEKIAEMDFKRDFALENVCNTASMEAAVYSLVMRKLSTRWYSGTLGIITPHYSRDVVDLGFVNSSELRYGHRREMEKYRILKSIASIGRGGCFPFLFWRRRHALVLKKDMNASLKESKGILERCLLRFPKISFKKGSRYLVHHTSGLEVSIELLENNLLTSCCFTLLNGDKLEFVDFIVDFTRLANQDNWYLNGLE